MTETAATPQPQTTPSPSPRFRVGLRGAILSGLLLWLAAPRLSLWPLAWVALFPLITSIITAQRFRQAIWRGYLFGWAFLAPVWYWTGLTIVGWTHSAIGWVAPFALTLILAWFYALWSGAAWWLSRRLTGGKRILAFACAWVIMEWARTLGSLSMPWAQLSYSQYRFLPILQIAEVTGAYGVSFLLVLVNSALAEAWLQRGQPQSGRWVWATLTASVLVCLFGLARLTQPENGRSLPVAVLQSNFENQTETESGTIQTQELRTIVELTHQAQHSASPPPALYVWSESAAPDDALSNVYPTKSVLSHLAQETKGAICIGGRIIDPITQEETNSSLLFPPDGSLPSRYDKRQLVPFGEYTPFRAIIPTWLDAKFHFTSDVLQGSGPRVLHDKDPHWGDVPLGPFICYESMYPQYARDMTRSGADLLVTQSNDRWFVSVSAMEQHLSAVVLRAIENRRNIARATTNGVTCLIDSRGRILARAPYDTPAYLVRTLKLMDEKTLYTRFGDWFVALCGLLIIATLLTTHKAQQAALLQAQREPIET
jgi:apolipoprotein N-acyltransferase